MATLVATARVSADEVKEIFETDMTTAEVNAAINIAHQLIAALDLAGLGNTAATLTQIELLLSAHFCALKDPRAQRENVANDFYAWYQGKTDMGLNSTFYGQNAIILDVTGTLADVATGRKRASLSLVFSAYDEQNVSTS